MSAYAFQAKPTYDMFWTPLPRWPVAIRE